MAEEDSSEKSEKATPHKLREALKKGVAAKSQEVNSLLLMAAALVLMYALGEGLVKRSFDLSRRLLSEAGKVEYEPSLFISWTEYFVVEGINILAIYVAPLMVVAVLASMLQTGVIFSFFPLKPDIQKLNPVKGFKRVFSLRSIVELIKSLLKIVILGLIIYFTIKEYLPAFFGLGSRSPGAYTGFFIATSGVLIARILIALVLIALVDLLFVRWEHQKQLRMSKKELKDEHKRFDGDPQIRQKRKEIARELFEKSKSLGAVSDADVIITNPTHYAIALKYDRNTMVAPKAISKGRGPIAAKIREIAGTYQIPVVSRPPLARKIYKNTRVGSYIRQDDYIEVAAILREVFTARTGKKSNKREADTPVM